MMEKLKLLKVFLVSLSQLFFVAVEAISLPAMQQEGMRIDQEAKSDVSFSLPTRTLFRAQFGSANYIFDLNSSEKSESAGGTAQRIDAGAMPTLFGGGVSAVAIDLKPCGINPFHVHPRATELSFVIESGPEGVLVGFSGENGEKSVQNLAKTGFISLFPQGLVHFAINLSCKPATIRSAFSSDDPGISTITSQGFKNLPADGLAASLGIEKKELEDILAGIPDGLVQGTSECLARCKIPLESTTSNVDGQY